MINMLIFEPHADDAYLSLGSSLAGPLFDATKVIVTMIPESPRREREAEEFARSVNASWDSPRVPPTTDVKVLAVGVQRMIDKYAPEAIMAPLGIQHEEHIALAEVFRGNYVNRRAPILTYVDVPYCAKMKNANDLDALIEGFSVLSYRFPSAQKAKGHRIFKSQSLFFRNNPPEAIARIPEVIGVRREHQ